MSLALWPRAKALFDEAQEYAPEERAAFLDAACTEDGAPNAELRREVERLLAYDAGADAYFNTLGHALRGPGLGDGGAPVPLPESVGPWHVIREIGRGGMGQVLEAARADGLYEQRVALKLVRPGLGADLVARFQTERRMLASLEHPGIARLIDGGVAADGRPYFAMEYVEGEPILDYADAARLGVEERLRLFLAVCEAVAYAHRRLIVHRDLKPTNILVTEAEGIPEPKLLDFGIAKLLDAAEGGDTDAGLTRTGHYLMTPEYAAPEQVTGGPVSTATDVYALGVLLFELLTGHRPYLLADRSPQAMARAVCEQEPGRPSTVVGREGGGLQGETGAVSAEEVAARRRTSTERLRRRLAGDLDTIVLQALRKEPERRYASVEALAADVRRHLDGRPVKARRDTVGYRTGKFVRRHRVSVAAAAIVMLALAVGMGVALWQERRAEAAAAEARLEAAKAQQVTAFLVSLFRGPDPYVSASARDSLIAARELLDRGVNEVEQLQAQPDIQAALLDAVAQTYQGLGLYDPALRTAEQALALRRVHHTEPHPDIAASLLTLGSIENDRVDLDRAAAHYREALALYDALPDPPPDLVAEAYSRLGIVEATRGEHDEAEWAYREALTRMRAVFGAHSHEAAVVLHNLADLARHRNRLAEAVVLFDSSIALHRALPGDYRLDLGASLTLQSLALRDQGEVAAAATAAEQALRVLQERLPPDHPRITRAELALGSALVQRGDPAAEPLLRDARAVLLDRDGPGHWRTAEVELWLGTALARQGRFAEAEPLLLRGYAVLLELRGDDDLYVRQVRSGLADLYDAWGRPDEADRYRPGEPAAARSSR